MIKIKQWFYKDKTVTGFKVFQISKYISFKNAILCTSGTQNFLVHASPKQKNVFAPAINK
jgi:hypothetical protein